VLDLLNTLLQLIDALPGVVRIRIDILCSKVSPLETVHRTKIALPAVLQPARVEERTRAIAIPDAHTLGGEEGAVGAPADKPEQLGEDAFEECAFRREQGEGPIAEGKAERGRGEDGECPSAGAIGAGLAAEEDVPDERQVLFFVVRR
jgi:hypothetical protein